MIVRTPVLTFLATALVAATTVIAPFCWRPGLTLDFDDDAPAAPRYMRGFYAAERGDGGLSFAWTSAWATITLRDLRRATAWRLEVDAAAPRRDATHTTEVSVTADQTEIARWQLAPGGFRTLVALVPSRQGGNGVRLDLRVSDTVVPGPQDSRTLGIMVDRVRLVPERLTHAVPWQATVAVSLSVALLAALASVVAGGARAAFLALLASGAVSALLFHGSQLYLGYASVVAWSVVPAVGIFLAGLLYIGWDRRPPRAFGGAVALSMFAVFLKLLVVLHPELTLGDSVFHLNRLRVVLAGNWLFTSQAPGGEFPYPVAFYACVALLRGLDIPWIPLMRGVVVTVDGFAALSLGAAVAARRGDRAGELGVAGWHLMSALFQAQAIAYLTNAFGNLLAAFSLTCLAWIGKSRAIVLTALASALATGAFLSHVSSCLILGLTLVVIVVFAAVSRRRTLVWATVATLCIASAASWVVYYRHFTALYAGRPAAARVAASVPTAPPIQRAEAHQTQWVAGWTPLMNRTAAVPGYIGKYWGWAAVALGLVGMWTLLRSGPASVDELGVTLTAWLVACTGVLIVGLLTPVDLRCYLAAAPALAALAAIGFDATTTSPQSAIRLGGYAAALVMLVQGVAYVVRFFGPVLPR